MKITGEMGLGKILKVFLQACFWGGIILLVIWPFQLQLFGLEPNAIALVMYPNGIALTYEVVLAKSMEPLFILILGFLFILFIGVAIALYILSELFKQATEYKTENELTI